MVNNKDEWMIDSLVGFLLERILLLMSEDDTVALLLLMMMMIMMMAVVIDGFMTIMVIDRSDSWVTNN